jgi:hypothetical protein
MMTDNITRVDLDQLRRDINRDMHIEISALRIEWRQEMITHIRWLVGLFTVQLLATVGATAGIVGWLMKIGQ